MYRVTAINGAGKVQHMFTNLKRADACAKDLVSAPDPSGRPSFPVAIVEKHDSVFPDDFENDWKWEVIKQYTSEAV